MGGVFWWCALCSLVTAVREIAFSRSQVSIFARAGRESVRTIHARCGFPRNLNVFALRATALRASESARTRVVSGVATLVRETGALVEMDHNQSRIVVARCSRNGCRMSAHVQKMV